MKNNEEFPLAELINFEGNRYELTQACIKRAYSLLIKKKFEEGDDFDFMKEEVPIVNVNDPLGRQIELEAETKIVSISMADVLNGKIKFYNVRREELENS